MNGVYESIAAIIGELATSGVAKSRRNQQQGFDYRGIDDVYNALAPLISKHQVVIIPRVMDRVATERQSKSGGVLFHNVVTMEFDFVSAKDGSKVTVGPMLGEAMDSGDKSISKAMSVAYKCGCFQAFCIPTEAADADADTHEVEPAFAAADVDLFVNQVADAMNADVDEYEQSDMIFKIHQAILSKRADADGKPTGIDVNLLYGAIGDRLAAEKIIGKANWKATVAAGSKRFQANGLAQ